MQHFRKLVLSWVRDTLVKIPTESWETEQGFTVLPDRMLHLLALVSLLPCFTLPFLTPVPIVPFLSKSPARRPSSQALLSGHWR